MTNQITSIPAHIYTSFDTKITNEIKPLNTLKKRNINISINSGPTPTFQLSRLNNIATSYKETSEKIKNKNSDKKRVFKNNNFIENGNGNGKSKKNEKDKRYLVALNSMRSPEDSNRNVSVQNRNLTTGFNVDNSGSLISGSASLLNNKAKNETKSSINSSYFPKNTITTTYMNDSNSTYKNQITFTHRNYNDSITNTNNTNLTNNSCYEHLHGGQALVNNTLTNNKTVKINANLVNVNGIKIGLSVKLTKEKEREGVVSNLREKDSNKNIDTNNNNNMISSNNINLRKNKSSYSLHPSNKNNVINVNNWNQNPSTNKYSSLNKKLNFLNTKTKNNTNTNGKETIITVKTTPNLLSNTQIQLNNCHTSPINAMTQGNSILNTQQNINQRIPTEQNDIGVGANVNANVNVNVNVNVSGSNTIINTCNPNVKMNNQKEEGVNNNKNAKNSVKLNKTRSGSSLLDNSQIIKNLLMNNKPRHSKRHSTVMGNHISHISQINSINNINNINSNQQSNFRSNSKDILLGVKSMENLPREKEDNWEDNGEDNNNHNKHINHINTNNSNDYATTKNNIENFKKYIRGNKSLSIVGIKEAYKELLKNKNIQASLMIKNFKLSIDRGVVISSRGLKENENETENGGKHNDTKENTTKENTTKENITKENTLKENITKENTTKENITKENNIKDITTYDKIKILRTKQASINLNVKHIGSGLNTSNKDSNSKANSNNVSETLSKSKILLPFSRNKVEMQSLRCLIQDNCNKSKDSQGKHGMRVKNIPGKIFSMDYLNTGKSIIQEEEPEIKKKISNEKKKQSDEEDFDDLKTIIKHIRFENINIYKENIFSQNNFLYNNFEEKFNVEFENKMFPSFVKRLTSQNFNKIKTTSQHKDKSISTQDTSSRKTGYGTGVHSSTKKGSEFYEPEKVNLFSVLLSKLK